MAALRPAQTRNANEISRLWRLAGGGGLRTGAILTSVLGRLERMPHHKACRHPCRSRSAGAVPNRRAGRLSPALRNTSPAIASIADMRVLSSSGSGVRWLDWRAECRPPFQTALRFVGGVIAVIGYATSGSRAEFFWLASLRSRHQVVWRLAGWDRCPRAADAAAIRLLPRQLGRLNCPMGCRGMWGSPPRVGACRLTHGVGAELYSRQLGPICAMEEPMRQFPILLAILSCNTLRATKGRRRMIKFAICFRIRIGTVQGCEPHTRSHSAGKVMAALDRCERQAQLPTSSEEVVK